MGDEAKPNKRRNVRWRKRVSPVTRFWSKVDRRGDGECWPWVGGYGNSDGYGRLRVPVGPIGAGGKSVAAHRFSYELHNGAIPRGSVVRHTCDNPPCCNPKHLLIGTVQDNVADRVARRRTADFSGEKNNAAKLTEEKVAMVRAYLSAGATQRFTADVFGVSCGAVQSIKSGKTWRHSAETPNA